MATYDRPIKAKLIVRLATGEEWEAKPEDFAKFDLVKSLDAYLTFDDHLRKVLVEYDLLTADQDVTDAALNPVRYFVEIALRHPDLLDHPEMAETFEEVAAIEEAILRDRARGEMGVNADLDRLRLHLLTEHCNLAAMYLDHDEAEDQHQHEHTGPGTIRNHDQESRTYRVREALRTAADLDGRLPLLDDEEEAGLAIELGKALERERTRDASKAAG